MDISEQIKIKEYEEYIKKTYPTLNESQLQMVMCGYLDGKKESDKKIKELEEKNKNLKYLFGASVLKLIKEKI